MDIFKLTRPDKIKYPIILSSPHSGTNFPEEVKSEFLDHVLSHPQDADWYVQRLYDFVLEMGIPLIDARYSRYVVDLNRDPENKALYNDGRKITGVAPTTSFLGEDLYKELPSEESIQTRIEKYYWPYYRKIESLISEIKNQFGHVLLWDAHSIKRNVPTIRKMPFPDMILGSNDEQSATRELIDLALETLNEGGLYKVQHNDPFKGGHITRYFGKPNEKVYALQLEMSQDLYLDESSDKYDTDKASRIRGKLKDVIKSLGESLL